MPTPRALVGSALPQLDREAFDNLSSEVNSIPQSLLYLHPQDHQRQPPQERWEEYGPSAAIRVATIDEFVADCYERDQYKGEATHIDRALLFRLVELGVERLTGGDNPLAAPDRFPRTGHVRVAEQLYTTLESAGLLTPSQMETRLRSEGLADHAEYASELAAAIEDVRATVLADAVPESYRTERMAHVAEMNASLATVAPSVDAVVVAGFTQFDPLEQELLARIVDTWPTVALVPTQTIQPSDGERPEPATGVDTGVQGALETYDELGCRYESIGSQSSYHSPDRRLAANLYRDPEQSPALDHSEIAQYNVTYQTAETIPDEVHQTAQQVRSSLADGHEPAEIGVVLTNPTEYASIVREQFAAHEIPFALATTRSLSETAVGQLVTTLGQLADEPRSVSTVLALLTNPLVSVGESDLSIDQQHLSTIATRVESAQLDRVLAHVRNPTTAAIESLLRDITALRHADIETVGRHLDGLFDRLGVTATLSTGQHADNQIRRERAARDQLDRVIETLEVVAPAADDDRGTTIDRLLRGIETVVVGAGVSSTENRVVVCGLEDSLVHEFEYIYVLGLTASHVPADPDQLLFIDELADAHPDFAQPDARHQARYHLGAVLGSDASVTLSRPEQNANGDPYVPAELITELRRLVDLEALTTGGETATPGTPAAVQRVIGQEWARVDKPRAHGGMTAVWDAVDEQTFTHQQAERIESGSACAAARATPEPSAFDGKLSPAVVDDIYPAGDRQPHSPSGLETYAACGFKYYMQNILDIEPPDEITRDPDPRAKGSYIHTVLERYYRSLQDAPGTPVPFGTLEQREQQLLAVALDELDRFEADAETAFHREWLITVLAGLGSPEANEYYGPSSDKNEAEPPLRGLFYRFLMNETTTLSKATARPAWFEARIGQPYPAGTPVTDTPATIETPHGTVTVDGLIDRIDLVPNTKPTQAVIRDYKTSSSPPSESDALLGLKLQLPLYGLMAEEGLSDIETVGAAYYKLSPPTSVNARSGLLTSQEMATWYGRESADTPLLRHGHPAFETHAAFRRFIEDTTPDRLGSITAAINAGRFQPTIVDAEAAGCRYCEYADVCDVRHHQRTDTAEALAAADEPAYVPPAAANKSVEDVVEET